MNPSLILDGSTAMAWCFDDERGDYALNVLRMLGTQAALTSSIWPLEVLNTLLVGRRRGRLDDRRINEFLNAIEALSIQVESPPARERWRHLLALGNQYGLSAYDAAYLELAMREKLPLATLDKALRSAADAAGAAVVVFP